MSAPTLTTPSPTATELAALAQLIAQHDPALMVPFLACVCRSRPAMKTCATHEPTDRELAALKALAHGAELIGSSRWGAAWLEARREETAAAIDQALSPAGRGARRGAGGIAVEEDPGDG